MKMKMVALHQKKQGAPRVVVEVLLSSRLLHLVARMHLYRHMIAQIVKTRKEPQQRKLRGKRLSPTRMQRRKVRLMDKLQLWCLVDNGIFYLGQWMFLYISMQSYNLNIELSKWFAHSFQFCYRSSVFSHKWKIHSQFKRMLHTGLKKANQEASCWEMWELEKK